MRTSAAQAVWEIVAATRLHADGGVSQGELVVPRPAGAGPTWTTSTLTMLLYRRCYLGRTGERLDAADADRRPAFAREDAELGAALRAADGGRHCWSPGWRVNSATAESAVLVDPRGLQVTARSDEYRVTTEGVELRFPTARPFASPGFFLVCGTSGAATGDRVVRWYLDIGPTGAAAAVGRLVESLDGNEIRYTFKVLSNPADYPRPDAAVLYAARSDFAAVHPVVLALRDELDVHFSPAVPLFSLRVRAGVGLAEDPPRAAVPVSFGQHRCTLVAQGIVAAGPEAGDEQRYAAVVNEFSAAGISIEAPHLNAGSPEFDLGTRQAGSSWAA